MSKSNIEEFIGVLWLIAALIAFSNDYQIWGYLFAIKAAFDTVYSISYAIIKKAKDKDNE